MGYGELAMLSPMQAKSDADMPDAED